MGKKKQNGISTVVFRISTFGQKTDRYRYIVQKEGKDDKALENQQQKTFALIQNLQSGLDQISGVAMEG
jgi:hypothetical protein